MKRFGFPVVLLAAFLALTAMTRFADAAGPELRTCDFDLKGGCRSGQARVTLVNGKVTGLDVDVI